MGLFYIDDGAEVLQVSASVEVAATVGISVVAVVDASLSIPVSADVAIAARQVVPIALDAQVSAEVSIGVQTVQDVAVSVEVASEVAVTPTNVLDVSVDIQASAEVAIGVDIPGSIALDIQVSPEVSISPTRVCDFSVSVETETAVAIVAEASTYVDISLSLSVTTTLAIGSQILNIKYVDTGGTKDYASLSDWETAIDGDLTAGVGTLARVYCQCTTGAADTTPFTISGWTTSPRNCIEIIVDPSYRHAGKLDETKYRLTATNASILLIQEGNVSITGMQFILTVTSGGGYYALKSTGTNGEPNVFDRCIAKGVLSSGTTACYGYFLGDGSGTGTQIIRNSIAYDFVESTTAHMGFRARSSDDTVTCQNCLAHNCRTGFSQVTGTALWKNCGAPSCNTGFSSGTQTTCSTSTPTFVNEDADDFHLDSSDTTWKDQGTDLSSEFTWDIDGQTRGASWDIGPDEYVLVSSYADIAINIQVTATAAFSATNVVPISINIPASASVSIAPLRVLDVSPAIPAVATVTIAPSVIKDVSISIPATVTVAITPIRLFDVAISVEAAATVTIAPETIEGIILTIPVAATVAIGVETDQNIALGIPVTATVDISATSFGEGDIQVSIPAVADCHIGASGVVPILRSSSGIAPKSATGSRKGRHLGSRSRYVQPCGSRKHIYTTSSGRRRGSREF